MESRGDLQGRATVSGKFREEGVDKDPLFLEETPVLLSEDGLCRVLTSSALRKERDSQQ